MTQPGAVREIVSTAVWFWHTLADGTWLCGCEVSRIVKEAARARDQVRDHEGRSAR